MNGHDEQLPREFGKYHLIERVAVGGMAELFRAKLYGAGGFEKDLAVKKILPNLGTDEAFVQMFMDEAMITVTLNHGNIAQVLDFGELAGEYFLVMEFVDGVDLQSMIKRSAEEYEPIPVEFSAYIVQEICRGLEYAHNKLGPNGQPLNIVHRDVSPQNVLLSFEGQVKLVDFGIARAASRITSTQAGVVKGKVAYMSPEQLMGKAVDGRSDVWAAGIILYELLSHRRPFEGATPQETMAAITQGSFKPPQKLNRQVNRKLAAVVKKSLERNVKRRFKSAGEMYAALSDYLHSTGNPPTPLRLARLIRERMPNAKPRTVQPTPIRRLRQEPTAQNTSAPPVMSPAGSVDVTRSRPAAKAEAPAGGSPRNPPARSAEPAGPFAEPAAGERPRKTTAPNFPEAGPAGAPGREIQVSEDQPVVVGADGEAISFGALGLPEDYAVSAAAAAEAEARGGQRTTEPDLAESAPDPSGPHAVPGEEASYADEEPTVVQPPRFAKDSDGRAHLRSAPDDADPELLRAASVLITQTGMTAASPVEDQAEPISRPPAEPVSSPPPESASSPPAALAPDSAPRPAGGSPTAASDSEIDEAVGELGTYEDDLLAAPTRLLDSASLEPEPPPAGPAPSGGPVETSDQMDAWMDQGKAAEQAVDFEDESPGRPRKKGPGLLIAVSLGALIIAGAIIFLVVDPFGSSKTSGQPGGAPGEMQPIAPIGPGTDQVADAGAQPAGAPAEGSDQKPAATAGTGPEAPAEGAVDAGPTEGPELAAIQPGSDPTAAGRPGPDAKPAVGPDSKPVDKRDAGPAAKPDHKPGRKKVRKPVRKPRPRAGHRPEKKPERGLAVAKGTGTLRINSEPFAVVYWGERRIGPTPQMDLKLPAGSHNLTLKNEALGLSKKVRVRIEADKVQTVFVNLKD